MMSKNMGLEDFYDLNFSKIGFWKVENNSLSYELNGNKENEILISNALYIFFDEKNSKILYVGKTTQTIEKSINNYIRGNGESTHHKIHNNLIKRTSKSISILVLNDIFPIKWGKYNINLAAGLKDSIIEIEKPEWNGS